MGGLLYANKNWESSNFGTFLALLESYCKFADLFEITSKIGDYPLIECAGSDLYCKAGCYYFLFWSFDGC